MQSSGVIGKAAWLGAGLTVLNTLVSVCADAFAKDLISGYAAPQLMVLAGMVAVLIGLTGAATGHGKIFLSTGSPALVALRSVFGVVSTAGFFLALRHLPFAELFLFIGIMPIMAAVVSGVIFREPISRPVWLALGVGFTGVLFLFPNGVEGICIGHAYGFVGSSLGTISMVLSRRICRSHTHSFAQVFYAQLACVVGGALFLGHGFAPIPPKEIELLLGYALFLIGTRWLIVVILRLLPAYVMMQIANVQFIWMVLMGQFYFGETTGLHIWIGSALVIGSGAWLLRVQHRQAQMAPRLP